MIDHEQHKFEAIYACGIVQFRQLFLRIREWQKDNGHITNVHMAILPHSLDLID